MIRAAISRGFSWQLDGPGREATREFAESQGSGLIPGNGSSFETEVKNRGRSAASKRAPSKGMSNEKANILAHDYLKDHPNATQRGIAKAIGTSTTNVGNTPVWKAFQEERRARRGAGSVRSRTVRDITRLAVDKGVSPSQAAEMAESIEHRVMEKMTLSEREDLFAADEAKRSAILQLILEQFEDDRHAE